MLVVIKELFLKQHVLGGTGCISDKHTPRQRYTYWQTHTHRQINLADTHLRIPWRHSSQ